MTYRRKPRHAVDKSARITDAYGWCTECPWSSHAVNAMATASIHARVYGHSTGASSTVSALYTAQKEAES